MPNSPDEPDLILAVAFTRTQYELLEDIEIFTADGFVADVGGMMGMLLGASFYSMFLGRPGLFAAGQIMPM